MKSYSECGRTITIYVCTLNPHLFVRKNNIHKCKELACGVIFPSIDEIGLSIKSADWVRRLVGKCTLKRKKKGLVSTYMILEMP